MNRELYDFQQEAVDNLRDTFRGGVRRTVLQLPTGGGKTMIASAIIERANERGQRTCFVVPAISLIDQTVEKFRAEGLDDIGVIQAGHPMTNYSRRNQICSVQTLKSRGYFPDSKLIVFDECHQLHDHHKKWLEDPAFSAAYFVGLSATPWTKGLGRYFDTLLIAARMQDLIDAGRLSKFRVFACPKADVSEVKITAGDYQVDQLSKASRKGTLTADIVHTWKTKWGQDKTLAFCVDCAHAQVVHERFKEAGVLSAYQDASTSGVDREDIRRGFHSGAYQVVCNVGTLTTGVDWDVRCISFARPTKSEMLYVQIVGRGLRTAPRKEHVLILDHTETTETLGFVTDIHHDELDCRAENERDPKEGRKSPAAKPCPSCAALAQRIARVCQNCGHQFPLHTTVETEDGELSELVPGRKSHNAKRVYTDAEKSEWFSMLACHSRQHGYKTGWAYYKFIEKFNEKPPSLRLPLLEPSHEVAMWIKSRQISYTKQRKQEVRAS
jgi:DNA repair protein RadD